MKRLSGFLVEADVRHVEGDSEDFVAVHAGDENAGLFEAVVAGLQVPRHEVVVGAFGLGAICHGLYPQRP